MRIIHRVPILRFHLVPVRGVLVAVEIPTAFEMTNVLEIVHITGLGCPMEVVGGAESGVPGTAVVIVAALELSSGGSSVAGRLVCVTFCLPVVKVLPIFGFELERFVLLPAIAHGGARREPRTFVFRHAGISKTRIGIGSMGLPA